MPDVLFDISDHVAVITLNRPERMNAVNDGLGRELNAALRRAGTEPEARAVLLTGAGRGFCSGLDLKERAQGKGGRTWAKRLRGLETPKIALALDKPIIGAINGPAIGVGFEYAMLCDYRIGTPTARMGDVHVKRGLVEDCADPLTLPRAVGDAAAKKILLTGEVFEPDELLRLGVLNEVVEADALMDRALDLAGRMAANPPLAVRMTKHLLRMANPYPFEHVIDQSMVMMGILQTTDDFKESIQAFVEKREARFGGR